MANQLTILSFEGTNHSLQVGDMIYWTSGGVNISNFNSSQVQNTKKLGEVMDITYNELTEEWDITVQYNDVIYPTAGDLPPSGSY